MLALRCDLLFGPIVPDLDQLSAGLNNHLLQVAGHAAIGAADAAAALAAAALALATDAAGAVHSRLRGFDGGFVGAELRWVGRVRRLFLFSHPLVYLRHHTLHRGD